MKKQSTADVLKTCLEFVDSGGLGEGVNANAKATLEMYLSQAIDKASSREVEKQLSPADEGIVAARAEGYSTKDLLKKISLLTGHTKIWVNYHAYQYVSAGLVQDYRRALEYMLYIESEG